MNQKQDYSKLFKMPKQKKITSMKSSITNAFVNSIIPAFRPTSDEIKEALKILGIDEIEQASENWEIGSIPCSYCGDPATEWDHLRPLVSEKESTGYISEIQNLVPSCGKCNQSKGNTEWKTWMRGAANGSPTSRGVKDLEKRIERIRKYSNWKKPREVNLDDLVEKGLVKKELSDRHRQNQDQLFEMMKKAQETASEIYNIIREHYKAPPSQT